MKGAAALGAIAVAGRATANVASAAHGEIAPRATDTPTVLDDVLVREQIAVAFYYTALTTPAIMGSPHLAGGSADPNNPGLPPNGNPSNVRYLQAALDAEMKHAEALIKAGATARYARFYFPAATFTGLGVSTDPHTFLGVLDHLESDMVGAYVLAAASFMTFGRLDLALLASRIMGVEAEHRTLGRVLSNLVPANYQTIEQLPFGAIGDAERPLAPYLTGRRFTGGATFAIALPTPAQATRIIGKYATRVVKTYV